MTIVHSRLSHQPVASTPCGARLPTQRRAAANAIKADAVELRSAELAQWHRRCEPWPIAGMAAPGAFRLQALSIVRRQVAQGETLFSQGDGHLSLFEICAGQFKTAHTDRGGRQQITGFHLPGELLGQDGIGTGRHCVGAVAMEAALVCTLAYDQLGVLCHGTPNLQREFHRLLSRDIVRDQSMMLMLGTERAQGRVAAFVLDLTRRLHVGGQSARTIVLRMTREDIGSYLGMTLETVSRTLARLQADGVLAIAHRDVRVLDAASLRRLAHSAG